MAGSFIHIRVDPKLKKESEQILAGLGLTMTTGIHLFLNSIIQNRSIPFEIKQSRENILGRKAAQIEYNFQKAAEDELIGIRNSGNPVALYDKAKETSYLEYPDGMRVYADE